MMHRNAPHVTLFPVEGLVWFGLVWCRPCVDVWFGLVWFGAVHVWMFGAVWFGLVWVHVWMFGSWRCMRFVYYYHLPIGAEGTTCSTAEVHLGIVWHGNRVFERASTNPVH